MTEWIFIRGLQREAAHFGDFGTDFEAAIPGAKVHFVDLPGNGVHHRVRTPLSVTAMMERVRAEVRERGIHRPHVLALSLGGMVTCDWAQRHPEELSGIVLVNTSFGGYSPMWHRFRPGAIPITLAVASERDPVRRELKLLPLASNRSEVYTATAARWAGVARVRPVSKMSSLRQLFAAARFSAQPHAPRVPHLILVGEGDRLVQSSCSHRIAAAWGSPISAHPSAGHDLTLDAGPWMIEQISAWLKALPVA